MKNKFGIAANAASDNLVAHVHPASSLRVPVTPANRALLRQLRAAESGAWEAGRPCLRHYSAAKLAPLGNHSL